MVCFHADSNSEAVVCTLWLPTFFDSTIHICTVIGSSSHGPRTLCRRQNNKKTTVEEDSALSPLFNLEILLESYEKQYVGC